MEIFKRILGLLFGVLIYVLGWFLGTWIFMLVVNWVGSLFVADFSITLLQAFGINVLLTLIGGFFKGVRR